MLSLRRVAMAGIALAGLVAFSLVPATPSLASGGLVYTVGSASANQEFLYCASSTPGPCTAEGHNQLFVDISANQDVNGTVHYELVNGTAVVGVDFYGPATGVQTISAGGDLLDVPLMISGATVPKVFYVKLTSASPAGDISSVGTETILPGNEIPSDCSMNLVSTESLSLTCTGRPVSQQWNLQAVCIHGFIQPTITGNTVTGDGTSTVTCSSFYYHVWDTGNFNVVS
jgi:hypothetical protein